LASILSPAGKAFLWKWRRETFRERPWTIVALVVLGIVNALAEGLSIGLLIPMLTSLFSDADPFSAMGGLGEVLRPVFAIFGTRHLLLASLGLIFSLVVLRSVAELIANRISMSLSGLIGLRLRADLYGRIAGVPFQYIASAEKGELYALLDTDSWQVAQAIQGFLQVLTHFVIAVAMTATMLAISARMTLLVAVLSIAYVALFSVTDRFNGRIASKRRQLVERLSTIEQESMDNMRTIRAFGREASSHRAFDEVGQQVHAIEKRKSDVNGLLLAFREPAYILLFALTLVVGRIGVSGAALIAILALLHRAQPHLTAINDYRQNWPQLAPSIEKISNLFAMTDAQPNVAGEHGASVKEAIAFEDVGFAYRPNDAGDPPAIAGLSMRIPHHKVTALVGPSGSGKTTIANLLLRLYAPQSGRIVADGTDITDLDLTEWRAGLSLAGQDAELSSGTLGENIAYGSPDATPAAIEHAATLAGIDDFIRSLPHGYDTPVKHRGLTLSGGQRQRIGLARALLRKDAMLILDEATNALDSLTEERVMRSLRELKGSATILIITHRLNVARIADHIVVLDRGRAVEEGSPTDVYNDNGLFRRMVDAQSFAQQLNQEGWLD
jgi:subfamily B ATP-binding cassette protein MsbA